MSARARSRRTLKRWRTRLSLGRARVLTAAGLNSGGFFIPYRYREHVEPPATPYPAVERLFERDTAAYLGVVDEMAAHLDTFATFGRNRHDPAWSRSMFPPLDGAVAYTLVRRTRPARMLEIGSGNSTRFLARALLDGEIACAFTCVDPAPRMPVAELGVRWIPRMLAEDDAGLCTDFGPGDILFIDSSHILLPGMDVDIEFNRIFPALAPGVLVHVHDIFLPFDYPPAMQGWCYSEQNALIGWIVSGFFEVVFPAHYVRRVQAGHVEERLGRHFPPLARRGAGSIWLRRSAQPAP